METVRYDEWVPAGSLVKGLMLLVFAITVCFTLLVLLFGRLTGLDVLGAALSWGVLGFVLFLFWNYRGLRIRISGDRLSVRYGLFNQKSFLLVDITSWGRTRASFGRYWGVGVRYGFDGSLAYSTSFGDAVMVLPGGRRPFVFSSRRPDEVCEAIRAASYHA